VRELIVQHVQNIVAAMSPWLVGAAAGFLVLWFVLFCRMTKPFAQVAKRFCELMPWQKFIVICAFSIFTLWGGYKERTPSGAALPDGFTSLMESSGGKGVAMIEGRATGSSLRLLGFIDGSQTPSFERALDIEVSSVEDMYRYVTLRGAVNDSGFSVQIARREPRYAAFASVVLMVERE